MARRSSRILTKAELETQANESFSSSSDGEAILAEALGDPDEAKDKDVHYSSSELNTSDSSSDEPGCIPPSPQPEKVPKRKKPQKISHFAMEKTDDSIPNEEDITDSPKGRYVKVISKQKNSFLNNVNQQKSHHPYKKG